MLAEDSKERPQPTSCHQRASLLIRCSEEEAKLIRAAAKREHRTLSGYVVNALLQRMVNQGKQAVAVAIPAQSG